MRFLLDTNVVSELRKGVRADRNVVTWFESLNADDLYLSVLVVGEIRRGIERIRRRDPKSVQALDRWLSALSAGFEDRILPVDRPVAEEWGRMNVPDPLPVLDALLAATAKVHDLVLATRNVKVVSSTGVRTLNPFSV
ncbi:MAG TPA: type II toxin-antitoxin system VapC family toxin [Thermoanaerobaculia bacterium]